MKTEYEKCLAGKVTNKYSHIIFDIDGTLLYTESAILQSLQDTVSEMLQKDMAKEDLKFALGIPGEVTLHRLGISDTRTANRKWNEYLLRYKSSIRLFKGIPALLASLKADGYSLGIVTSKNRNEYNEDFASVFDAAHYFDRVICVEDAPFPKPDPAPLITYLSLSGISAKEALYVGDTAYDSLCANRANVDFGIALWGNTGTTGNDACNGTQNDIDADYIFHSPSDLLDVL